MSIHNFSMGQEFISIDNLPDHRTEQEKQFTDLSLFNHDSPDLAYYERNAEELVNISGAWTTIFLRTDNNGTVDEVWEEDPDPTYKAGEKLKGYFAPDKIAIELTKWGVDTPNKTAVVYSRAVLFKRFGRRMLRPGDVIEIPHNTLSPVQEAPIGGQVNRIDKYRIIDVGDTGNFKYRWLYYRCFVENLTGDVTIQIEHR